MFEGLDSSEIISHLGRAGFERQDNYSCIIFSGEDPKPIQRHEVGLLVMELEFLNRQGLEVLVLPGELVNGPEDAYIV